MLLFDEADCLSEQTLITFLRQLRDGYINRVRAPFPSSVALVGMRNIRDYPPSPGYGAAGKAKIRTERYQYREAAPHLILMAFLGAGACSGRPTATTPAAPSTWSAAEVNGQLPAEIVDRTATAVSSPLIMVALFA